MSASNAVPNGISENLRRKVTKKLQVSVSKIPNSRSKKHLIRTGMPISIPNRATPPFSPNAATLAATRTMPTATSKYPKGLSN